MGSALLAGILLFSVFLLPVSASASTSLPTGITLVTTENFYIAGKTVRVLAEIHSYSAGNDMLITVYAPDQAAFTSRTLNNTPRFVEFSFNLNQGESRLGQWTVVALYADQRAESTFTLVDQNDFHQIILGKPLLRNMMGEELASENQRTGMPMAITAEIQSDEDDSSQQFVFIAQVLDSNGLPVHLSFVLGSVDAGNTTNPTVNWTPGSSGAYTIEVFVWTSLDRPIPFAHKQSNTFEILP
jgi:hypothetical protein